MKPISKTAFYCCGVRMQDAEREKPVCGDTYARVFMNEEGLYIHNLLRAHHRPPPTPLEHVSQFISLRFATDSLEQTLAPFSGRSPVTVVIEGVLMSLE